MLACTMYTMLSVYLQAGTGPFQAFFTDPGLVGNSGCSTSYAVPATLIIRNGDTQSSTSRATCGVLSITYTVNDQKYNLMSPMQFYMVPTLGTGEKGITVDLIQSIQGYSEYTSSEPLQINVASCPDGSPPFLGYIDILGYGVADPNGPLQQHAKLP